MLTEPESMRWSNGCDCPKCLYITAADIVLWIKRNDGDARYVERSVIREFGLQRVDREACIIITKPNGWVAALPRDTIAKGQVVGVGPVLEYRIHEDSGMDLPVYASTIREFTVSSPEAQS